jgi:5-hydroxyisourate hydrolase
MPSVSSDTSKATSNPTTRLESLASHLASRPSPINTNMADRDPITCHVLDTTTGLPAADLTVSMRSTDNQLRFSNTTNSDGRIAQWNSEGSGPGLRQLVQSEPSNAPRGWIVTFSTGAYYSKKGIQAFFPKVEVEIEVPSWDRHVHVPLLLGPYSYSTYRGS